MQSLKIFYFCALLILSCLSFANARPLQEEVQRRIVQPTWLADNNRAEFPSDGKVRITPENLRETAEWRAIIQKAVNEGRYAVDLDHDLSEFNPEEYFRSQPFPQPPPQFGPSPLAPFNPPWLPLAPPPQPFPQPPTQFGPPP
ncbi:formin-like, partial [Bactrocera dorsalis]|uniref:Formin-like n=1 Tax=Bactrocera dorsalis TaxID=27457 RepID=A0A6I9UW76_BACDO